MKRMLWMAVLALALPVAAFADGVDITNKGGTLTGSNAGFSLSNSELISVGGAIGDLGTLNFTTGAFTGTVGCHSGVCGTFAGGGSFDINGNGNGGLPAGPIFTGSFTCNQPADCAWTESTLANGTHSYTLTGTITGTWYTGATVFGATVQLTSNTGTGYFTGSVHLGSGDTNVTIPEPGSLSLLGTGLIGLAGLVRRKLKI